MVNRGTPSWNLFIIDKPETFLVTRSFRNRGQLVKMFKSSEKKSRISHNTTDSLSVHTVHTVYNVHIPDYSCQLPSCKIL